MFPLIITLAFTNYSQIWSQIYALFLRFNPKCLTLQHYLVELTNETFDKHTGC